AWILARLRAGRGLTWIAGVALRELPGVVDGAAQDPATALIQRDRHAGNAAEVDVREPGVVGAVVGGDEFDAEQVADVLVEHADVETQPVGERLLVAEVRLHGLPG